MIYLRIAFRNLARQRKQSILIGTALFVSLLLFIGSNTIYNGLDQQIIKNYLNLQTGDVVVLMENTREIPTSEVTRVYDSSPDARAYETDHVAYSTILQWLAEDKGVTAVAPVLMSRAKAVLAKGLEVRFVYGATQEDGQTLLRSGTLRPVEGAMDFGQWGEVGITESFAITHNLKVGDPLVLNVTSPWGGANSQEYRIAAVFSSISAWDDYSVFMCQEDARALLDMGDGGFQFCKIRLADPNLRHAFRDQLNQRLLAQGITSMHAEVYDEASQFIMNFAGNNRMFFDSFNIFLLLIIASGISATIRMNLFNRMPELGTMRALGYSKQAIFMVCFLEIAIVTAIALILVVLVVGLAMVSTMQDGIRIPNPFVAMALGSDHFYLVFSIELLLKVILVCLALVFLAVWRASQDMGAQAITSILAQKPEKVDIFGRIVAPRPLLGSPNPQTGDRT